MGISGVHRKRPASITAYWPITYLTRPTRLERATFGSTVRCSNQLSYGPVILTMNVSIPAEELLCQLFLHETVYLIKIYKTNFFTSALIAEPGPDVRIQHIRISQKARGKTGCSIHSGRYTYVFDKQHSKGKVAVTS
jgi:hypothetical protein